MLQFILGAIVGGFVTFLVMAVLSIIKTDAEEMSTTSTPSANKTGENDATK